MQRASRKAHRPVPPQRPPARRQPARMRARARVQKWQPVIARQDAPVPHPARHAPARPRPALRARGVLAIALVGTLALTTVCLMTLVVAGAVMYGGGKILPGVQMAGVALGGMTEPEAAQALAAVWAGSGVILRDGERVWSADPVALGITLDPDASAAAARSWGRSVGGPSAAFRAVLGKVALAPVLRVDWTRLGDYLREAGGSINIPAKNAGVRLVSGRAEPTPAEPGRALDIPATLARLQRDPGAELADGALDLVMAEIAPAITDASALVAQAQALLASPFTLRAYDPIRDEWATWTAPPEVWSNWITAASDPDSPTGLALVLEGEGPTAFIEAQARFGDERYIKPDEALAAMQAAIRSNRTDAIIRVWHNPTTYTVSAGQTLAQIGEEVGIPYPYIQAANPGINANALSAGQTLTLPSRDVLVPLEPVPHKRIIISRSQQRMWAYENGQVVFDWPISTGISSSPTAPGVFQVQSHEINAYAEQWNLYMPHFVGFYHPGPNVEVMNGFHGFPTSASGGYLLWTNNLGRPATYGCILLSLENAATLYDWAEEGVIVEVRR